MSSECDQSPATVNWTRLSMLQEKVVDLVVQLSSGQLLLVRELRSLAHLSQLSRREDLLENTINTWRRIIRELCVEKWYLELNIMLKKLNKWKQKRKDKIIPDEEEIKQFLWLM